MEEQKNMFEEGKVVYHKANNKRMVIIAKIGVNQIKCRFEPKDGNFTESTFFVHEVTPKNQGF